MKYFAVTNANGLISQELTASTKSEAIAEVKAAVADKSAIDWIDGSQTDMEDELGINCDNLSFSSALEKCAARGAEYVWGDQSDDSWNIWSVESSL